MRRIGVTLGLVCIGYSLAASAEELALPASIEVPTMPVVFDTGEQLSLKVSVVDPVSQQIDTFDETSSQSQAITAAYQELLDDCSRDHYLLGTHPDGSAAFNRVQWWGKAAPSSGPIRLNGDSTTTFECEFFPGLATVVGAELAVANSGRSIESLGYTTLAWDTVEDTGAFVYPAPESVTGIGFAARAHSPHSVPGFEIVTTRGGMTQRAFVNRLADGHALDPQAYRPPLILDFAFPQRAVGLEYGFVPEGGAGDFPFASVRLRAFDAQGTLVAESTGDFLAQGGNDVEVGVFDNRIGVLDRDGRIVSVELEFRDHDPINLDQPVLHHQALSRVWHVPLPPAAVLQASVAIGQPAGDGDGESSMPVGAQSHRLPFNHDRAIALLRGFNTRFTDNRPHKIARLGASVDAQVTPLGGGRYSVSVSPDAFMLPSADNSGLANDALVHYSVLSWNSYSTEMFEGRIDGWSEGEGVNETSDILSTRDPCPVSVLTTSSDPDTARAEGEARCGALFVALDDFSLSSNRGFNDQSFDRLSAFFGSFDRYFNRGLNWMRGPYANAFNDDRSVGWGVSATLDGDGDDGVFLQAAGTLLTGRSMSVGPDSVADSRVAVTTNGDSFYFEVPRVMTRPAEGDPDHWIYDWDEVSGQGISWPLIADMGLVSIRWIDAWPRDALREFEVELDAANYDGEVLDWRMGVGLGAGNRISGGASSGSGLSDILVMPQFAGVTRRSRFGHPDLETVATSRCEGVAGLGAQACDNWAVVRNTGDHQVLILDVAPGTHAEDARFRYAFLWRDERLYDLDSLRDRLPLQLRPGEDLLVGARYTPEDPGDGRDRWVDTGFLNMTTGEPSVNATVAFTGVGHAPSPGAEWRPTSLEFRAVSVVGASTAQPAALVSTGATPLLINFSNANGGLYFEDDTLGFSVVAAPHQPEPEVFVVFVDYVPQSGTSFGASTDLIADTNAGLIRIPVRARPLSLNGIGGP